MCFRCGGQWHEGDCDGESEWKNEQRLKYLLIAKCIKCQAPISKNGACKHMTCTRCRAEFCWICRKKWQGHYARNSDQDITWQLGCNELSGDTAKQWLCNMLCHLLVLPFYAVFISGVKLGLFLHMICFHGVDQWRLPSQITGVVGLSVLFMPVQAVILAVLFPALLITRLYQILKMFFVNIAGTCCLGCCKCCCF